MSARWTPDESDDLDREVRAMRKADKPLRPRSPDRRGTTALTEAELQRRKKVARAMQVREDRQANVAQRSATYRANRSKRPGRVREPVPKQKPNGRWVARCVEKGRQYQRTFDTPEEAQAFLDAIKEGE